MYPELFRIPFIDYSISSFGAMLSIAFLSGFFIARKHDAKQHRDAETNSGNLFPILWKDLAPNPSF